MKAIGWGISILGVVALIIGSIWFLVAAFKQDVFWGLACLLIPFVSLIFLFNYWNKASRPFGIWLGGWLGLFLGKFVRDGTLD